MLPLALADKGFQPILEDEAKGDRADPALNVVNDALLLQTIFFGMDESFKLAHVASEHCSFLLVPRKPSGQVQGRVVINGLEHVMDGRVPG